MENNKNGNIKNDEADKRTVKGETQAEKETREKREQDASEQK